MLTLGNCMVFWMNHDSWFVCLHLFRSPARSVAFHKHTFALCLSRFISSTHFHTKRLMRATIKTLALVPHMQWKWIIDTEPSVHVCVRVWSSKKKCHFAVSHFIILCSMLNARAVYHVLSKSILLSYRIHKRLWETFLFSIVVVVVVVVVAVAKVECQHLWIGFRTLWISYFPYVVHTCLMHLKYIFYA